MPVLGLNGSLVEEAVQKLEAIRPIVDEIVDSMGLAADNRVQLMRAGYELKDVYGLTEAELDALFQSGCQALGAGGLQQAKWFFSKLCQLDSLNAHYVFALASALQMEGEFESAGRLYFISVGLKATWVEAYVRLGECLIACDELDNAREMLEIAVELASGSEESEKGRAEALLAQIPQSDTAV